MLGREHLIEAARLKWGPENKKLSKAHELRFGTYGSKSVDLNDLVWHDHETGEGGGIVELCREMGVSDGNGASGNGQPWITYDYKDEQGDLLFQVVRKPGHKFLQRQPNPAPGDHGGEDWIWNLKDVRRVPYRLPQLVNSAGLVIVVEGEKDADNLARLGYVTTTNPGGAGKWLAEYSHYLAGRAVVVIPDNDEPGLKHARDVMNSLGGIASAVTELRLDGCKDVSVWIDKGGTREAFEALLDEAFRKAREAPPPPTGLFDMTALKAETFDELQWIVPGFIPEGVTLIGGKPKIGKSWLMLCTALAVADGNAVLGKVCEQRTVIYYALEDTKRRLKARTEKLIGLAVDWPKNMLVSLDLPNLDHGCVDRLRTDITAHHPGLVIIDTLAAIRGVKGKNEDQYQCDYRTMRAILDVSRETNTAIVVIHHVRKQTAEDVFDMISGTMGLSAVADTLLVLTFAEDEQRRIAVRGRDVDPEDKLVTFDPDTGDWIVTGDFEPEDKAPSKTITKIVGVLAASPTGLTPKQVADKLGANYETIKRALARNRGKHGIEDTGYGTYAYKSTRS